MIYVQDVNDKKPVFTNSEGGSSSYTHYVLESVEVGTIVATLVADDADRVAELEYSIVEPISARDKTGNVLNNRA